MNEPVDLKRYQRIQEAAARLRSDADRAAGALDQVLEEIRKEFGVKGIPKAEALHEELEEKVAALAKKYEKAAAKVEMEFGDKLEEFGNER